MFHNILVAIDGSQDAERALTEAIDLAESEHGRLTLLISVPSLPSIGYIVLSDGVYAEEVIAGARSWAEAVLLNARDRVPAMLPVTTILSEQPIRAALIKQTTQGRHDLIAMGSRGRGAIRAALLGSVSHYMLRHSPIPILIVHANHIPDRSLTDGRGGHALRVPSVTPWPTFALAS